MRFLAPILFVAALAACETVPSSNVPTQGTVASSTLPPVKTFPLQRAPKPNRSNREIARDFMDLSFEMESGKKLDTFTRFEGPVTIKVTGKSTPSLENDLNKLIHRLRNEAKIDIQRISEGNANITIEAVTKNQIRRALPQAACFVVPNVSSLSEYRRQRNSERTNWSNIQSRTQLAVFLPNDTSPQEIRDCLHEEVAQALGPLNDLYRLPDSVFNDDNVHAVLTGFDMLVLRTYYSPSLRNGMSRAEVESRLPGILAAYNPGGQNRGSEFLQKTPRDWINATQTALGPSSSYKNRVGAAQHALNVAKTKGWTDHRLGFSHYVMGRLSQGNDGDVAINQYLAADRAYSRARNAELYRAFIAVQLSGLAIAQGKPDQALKLIQPQLPIARRAENAALLSTLMMLEAEALDMKGLTEQANNTRSESLGWARYGFGSDWAVRSKLREIAALNPLKTGS